MKKVKLAVGIVLLLSLIGGTIVFASAPLAEPQSVLAAYPCPTCTGSQHGWFCISADWMIVNQNSKVGDVNYFNPNCVWSHYQECRDGLVCQCAPPGTADWCG